MWFKIEELEVVNLTDVAFVVEIAVNILVFVEVVVVSSILIKFYTKKSYSKQ